MHDPKAKSNGELLVQLSCISSGFRQLAGDFVAVLDAAEASMTQIQGT